LFPVGGYHLAPSLSQITSDTRGVTVVEKRYFEATLVNLSQNLEPETRPRETDIACSTIGEETYRIQTGHWVFLRGC